jgi:hypothetical protein
VMARANPAARASARTQGASIGDPVRGESYEVVATPQITVIIGYASKRLASSDYALDEPGWHAVSAHSPSMVKERTI